MSDTTIEWTQRPGTRGRTWNPTNGCDVISPGCANCYAMRFAGRFAKPGERYHGLVAIGKNKRAIWTGETRFEDRMLALPLRWRQPSTVFVNSMSDLFHDGFTNEQIAAVYGVMAACPQHTFIVLTKRERLRKWYEWVDEHVEDEAVDLSGSDCSVSIHDARDDARLALLADAAAEQLGDGSNEDHDRWYDRISDAIQGRAERAMPWPLPNVWIGVSVEDRKHGLPRIDELRRISAAVRMLSIEPLLEDLGTIDLTGIGWVVVGCESGPGARPCDVTWLRSLRDQCRAAGVPFFLKQAVSAWPEKYADPSYWGAERDVIEGPGSHRKSGGVIGAPYLDGVQHLAFPEAT